MAPARAGPDLGSSTVEIIDTERRLDGRQHRWLADKAREALARLGTRGHLCVRILGDPAMSVAHERFAGVPGSTDVLTFDNRATPAAPDAGPLEADILACVDEAQRQAATRGHALERELLLYILHGVLHCLGHDDHDEAGARRMHGVEDEVLEAIGVGATYARPGAPGGGP